MFDQILAEHALGLRGVPGAEELAAERLTQRVEPDRRLVVRDAIPAGDNLPPQRDRFLSVAARGGEVSVEHAAGEREDGAGRLEPSAAKERGVWHSGRHITQCLP